VISVFDIPVLMNGCVSHNKHSIVASPMNCKNRPQASSEYQDAAPQRNNDKISLKPQCASKVSDNNPHKVVILGDSHVRCCSEKLAGILGSGFTVTGISKPNAND
jgi:hypothetical protein